MKIKNDKGSCFFKTIQYAEVASRKSVHVIVFICWFLLIVAGTTIIGVGTSLIYTTFSFCSNSQSFCTQNIVFNKSSTMNFYLKLSNIHQNNRGFMDAYSTKQLHGQVGSTQYCSGYSNYGQMGTTTALGGYRVPSTADAHPCGYAMKTILSDSIYLVDSQGGTPSLSSATLISPFLTSYHFIPLTNPQLSQWVDVDSNQFVSWFTIPATSTKYILLGQAAVTAGNYQLIMQNNWNAGDVQRDILVTEVGAIGITNHWLGFTLFVAGILYMFGHVALCFRWRK